MGKADPIFWRAAAAALAGLAVLLLLAAMGPATRAQETPGFELQPPVSRPNVPVMSQRQLYCMQLEGQLQRESRNQESAENSLPRIESELYRTARAIERNEAQAEKLDCFDYFLFAKDWRNTPRCNKVRQQIDAGQRTIERLQRQRDQIANGQVQRTRVEALIEELARNRCGQQYVQEARRRQGAGSFFWDDSEGDPGFGASVIPQPTYATYRTLCVRSCDGYYFPISFTATQASFQRDANQCQAQCAAPARLFIYQNPGAEVEQAVSADGQVAYSQLPNAFRYRRELVKGCSCKAAEYDAALFPPEAAATASLSAVAEQPLIARETANGAALFSGDETVKMAPASRPRRKPRPQAETLEERPRFLR